MYISNRIKIILNKLICAAVKDPRALNQAISLMNIAAQNQVYCL